jgi:hypothetical protein
VEYFDNIKVGSKTGFLHVLVILVAIGATLQQVASEEYLPALFLVGCAGFLAAISGMVRGRKAPWGSVFHDAFSIAAGICWELVGSCSALMFVDLLDYDFMERMFGGVMGAMFALVVWHWVQKIVAPEKGKNPRMAIDGLQIVVAVGAVAGISYAHFSWYPKTARSYEKEEKEREVLIKKATVVLKKYEKLSKACAPFKIDMGELVRNISSGPESKVIPEKSIPTTVRKRQLLEWRKSGSGFLHFISPPAFLYEFNPWFSNTCTDLQKISEKLLSQGTRLPVSSDSLYLIKPNELQHSIDILKPILDEFDGGIAIYFEKCEDVFYSDFKVLPPSYVVDPNHPHGIYRCVSGILWMREDKVEASAVGIAIGLNQGDGQSEAQKALKTVLTGWLR